MKIKLDAGEIKHFLLTVALFVALHLSNYLYHLLSLYLSFCQSLGTFEYEKPGDATYVRVNDMGGDTHDSAAINMT